MTNVCEAVIAHVLDNQEKFYKIAYSYTYNKESALDIVQNAICKALEKADTLRNRNAVKTWFYRILVNESLMYLRSTKKEIPYAPEELKEEGYESPSYELKAYVKEQLEQLPEEQQTIVILHHYEELTFKEISRITRVSESTVKTRYYAAINKLQGNMEKEDLS